MTTEMVIMITESGKEIMTIECRYNSAFPLKENVVLELNDFIEKRHTSKNKAAYLSVANEMFELIKKHNSAEKLSPEMYKKLHILNLTYKGLKNEKERKTEIEMFQDLQGKGMLIEAIKIKEILKDKENHITGKEVRTMKKELLSKMPSYAELMDFPPEILKAVLPYFKLLKMFISVVPEEGELVMINNIMQNIYGMDTSDDR